MSSIRVIMDNHNSACYPGQTITGRVECNFNKQKGLRAVKIKFKGKAETEWYEDESYYDNDRKEHKTRRVRYYADEEYFNAEYNLIQGGDNFSLSAGRHNYPFSYILPPQLPSSYEGAHGNIRYSIKATIDRPWKFDYEETICLNIVSPLDLNFLPNLREPVNTSVDKTMCSCWCNDSGALTFNVSLPARGFVPGQEISIGCHVENMTNVNAEKVKFKITEDIDYVAHYPSTKYNSSVVKIAGCKEGGIGAHGEKSWTSSLTIPTGHYPNLKGCSIIKINYTLKGEVVVPCPHTDLEMYESIVIGTVPLSGVNTSFLAGPPPGIISEGTPLLPPFPGAAALPPYPPAGGSTVPYPPTATPLPGGFHTVFGEKSPSAPLPGGFHSNIQEKIPSAPPGDVPYPAGGPPYPSGGAQSSAPYPPPSTAGGFAPPSYEETQKLNEKHGKPE